MGLKRRDCLGWLAGLAWPASSASSASNASAVPAKPPMMLAPMLAREADPAIDPAGWLVSEKLDGVRAIWDGHALRFRSGLPVAAPAWFVARLPAEPLDGELWLGRGRFETLSGTVRRALPRDDEWRALRYAVFDQPSAESPFADRALRLQSIATRQQWPQLVAIAQQRLADRQALAARLADVVQGGGEGLMLHRADAVWQPGRSDALLKLKPMHDAEAIVIGHVAGRGRHAGRLGALRVRCDEGVEFLLGTGFSDSQRDDPPAPGAVVTYRYRGSTAAGVPRFASFLRVREP